MALVICTHNYTIIILAILSCGLTVGISQNIVCDYGWTEHSGRCYLFKEDITVTWEQAKSYCNTQKNSHLVSVIEDSINQFLFDNKRDNTEHWIGLKPFDNATWGWNDGSPDMDIPWGEGATTGDAACARFKSSKLFYAFGCQNKSPSLCERDTQPHRTGMWKLYNQHWYLLLSWNLSPQAATHQCILLGGYLARLTTNDERTFVSDNIEIPVPDGVWVGLTRFVWDDGSGYEWHAWGNGYPIDTKCVALGQGGNKQEWKSKGCTTQLNFICVQASITQSTMIHTTPTVTNMQSVTLSTTKVTTADKTPVEIRTSSSSSSVQFFTERISQTQMSKLWSTQTHAFGKDSTAAINYPVIEQTSNIVGTGENLVNATTVSGLVIGTESKVLWNVLYVIYTLVCLMLVTDVVLLVIYLKLKNKPESVFDRISSTNDDETPITDIEQDHVTSPYSTVGHSPTHQKSTFPIYAIPNKHSLMPKSRKTKRSSSSINDEDENQYPEIPVHTTVSPTHDNKDFPVYAVPNKRKPRDMEL